MADTAAGSQPVTTPAKAGKVAKPKKAGAAKAKKISNHPKYSQMIKEALGALKERGGSSRQAILKYILKHYPLGNDEKIVNAHLKLALRAGIKNGTLKQSKGTGASGSFRLGEKKADDKPKKAKKPKKAAGATKAKKPKKAATKPKKPKAAGSPKKAAAKPKKAKAAAKPKAAKPKSPAKPKAVKAKKPKSPKAKKPKAAAKPKKVAKK